MKPRFLPIFFCFLFSLFFTTGTNGQNFGPVSSAVYISDCNQSNYFNVTGSGANLIGPSGNVFTGGNLGVHTQNSATLHLKGGQVRTFKTAGLANVCTVKMYYRVYAQTATPGSFSMIDLPLLDDCNAGTYPSGGSCQAGDQKWDRVIPNGATSPYAPVDLTAYAPGNYNLEIYFEVTGSNSSATGCGETVTLNNGGAYYKSTFSIQSPSLTSNNPTTCNGNDGSIIIEGLVAGKTYEIIYNDDAAFVGPTNYTANSSGQIILNGLNAGTYSNFTVGINGCYTDIFVGQVLSNPVITPTFNKINPFCAGSPAPVLPTVSTNGISGTWSPATVNNQNSGTYTFTPNSNQCAITAYLNVIVKPNVTPTFSFGTSLSICDGATVPVLPTTSTNSINGTWSPAVINNHTSGTYTFTPTAGQCATSTTLAVTVTPNITPTFDFGTMLSICDGAAVPALPGTSNNGITGTWSPAAIDNHASGNYTFTPTSGQCATTTSLSVTVTPNATPAFSFGNSLSICAGGTVPVLPATSDNGINGTWSPATVDNMASGTYTFTPSGAQCALPFTFTVTVNPNITPTFSFGTSLSVCDGATVPSLPGTSNNGITGTWSPSAIDNHNSSNYTFTPTAGQCATSTTLAVSVNPNITPTFSFGSTLTVCEGASVPALPATSVNGINGSWSPATVDNMASGTYTFTPASGQCATTTTFTVTVNPNVVPAFGFGTSLTICAGSPVPVLPGTSTNSITGTWSPATVDNMNSGTYTFTPASGQCATTATFTVTVNPNILPSFSFGTSLTICAGAAVPALPGTSNNSISGTWSPATVDNMNSGTYTFTPTAGQCATTTTFSVTVNPNVTPVFAFGTSLTICEAATAPALPATSNNGISGTWSPAAIDNMASGTYTFTPTAGQCAVSTSLTVNVNPNVTPSFSFGTAITICEGDAVPGLPSTSNNGVSGTWNPSVINNTASGSYTFTPGGMQCAPAVTLTVTVNPYITPAFSFGTSLSICKDAAVPALPGTSTNGISGSWSPAVVSNQNSDTYTFTPTATPGQCLRTTTFTVTVNPNVVPAFAFGTSLTICDGATVPALTGTSSNGINGTWSPATIDNHNSGTYTFTPASGQCATGTTLTVTVNPNIVPTFSFGSSLTICAGGTVPVLPATSDNGINGSWSPATVDNMNSATYTFTPTGSQCATSFTFNVTVNPNVTPAFSFGTSLSVCDGATVPSLPATSNNSINGSWSPAVIDNHNSGTYTFTPASGQCAVGTTLTVTVNPIVTPTFSFGTTLTICDGSAVPALATTSANGISGTWNAATIDNHTSATYTFTPSNGQCATGTSLAVTVNPNIVPSFNFGNSLTICAGSAVPVLPGSSNNGINGSWSPATIDNMASGTYTFTASGGQCATGFTFTVTVNPNITPSFSFGTSISVCDGAIVPALPTTSANGVTGTWSPAVIDNHASGTYTFTQSAGQCATGTTLTVTVNPNVTPVFDFGTSFTTCSGTTVPALPNTSTNGISGTWSPAVVDNQASKAYTFTPTAGQCATTTTFNVTITPTITPTFSFGTAMSICKGATVPALPAKSIENIDGVWDTTGINNQATRIYTFTPTATPDQCIKTVTLTVTVNDIVTPAFSFGSSLTLCAGQNVPALAITSTNGINGTWSPAAVSNQASGTYTFTSADGQCAVPAVQLQVTVNPVGIVNMLRDTAVNDGAAVPANILTGSPSNVSFSWTNSNTAIGLSASGTGNIAAFTAKNNGDEPVISTITVTPEANGCKGTPRSYVITVNALTKDLFVPNVFTPNADGKNDQLYVYGAHVDKLDMRIYNQWGQQVHLINNLSAGWDGTFHGKPQPVGVYVYTLRAVMTDGRIIESKGNITLLR